MPDKLNRLHIYIWRGKTLILAAILLLAAFLRTWISGFEPIMLDYDAFYHARIAEQIYQDHHVPTWDRSELGGIPHYYPPSYHILVALGRYILPGWDPVAVGSVLTVFFGTTATLFVYLIGREFDRRIGLVSAMLFALTPMMALRSGLWARPTGLSMLFTVLVVYLFLRAARKDNRYAALALVAALAYTFAHSSALLAISLVLAASLISRDARAFGTFSGIALLSLAAGAMYYYRALPFLNFSISRKGEYMSLVQPLLEAYPFSDIDTLAAAFLFLALFSLAVFPVALHGVYGMLQRRPRLGIIALLSLLMVFFKANMFMLLNFAACIAIAVSIFRIYDVNWKPLALLLLLTVAGTDALALQEFQGAQKHAHADITAEILSGAPLTSGNTVLAADPIVGHAIPYYSQASTFLSDLTDIKQYDRNREVFDRLTDKDTGADEATSLLIENDIDHLLVFDDATFPFLENQKPDFALVRETQKNGATAYLYKVKK